MYRKLENATHELASDVIDSLPINLIINASTHAPGIHHYKFNAEIQLSMTHNANENTLEFTGCARTILNYIPLVEKIPPSEKQANLEKLNMFAKTFLEEHKLEQQEIRSSWWNAAIEKHLKEKESERLAAIGYEPQSTIYGELQFLASLGNEHPEKQLEQTNIQSTSAWSANELINPNAKPQTHPQINMVEYFRKNPFPPARFHGAKEAKAQLKKLDLVVKLKNEGFANNERSG